jgi:hypothetical protein
MTIFECIFCTVGGRDEERSGKHVSMKDVNLSLGKDEGRRTHGRLHVLGLVIVSIMHFPIKTVKASSSFDHLWHTSS